MAILYEKRSPNPSNSGPHISPTAAGLWMVHIQRTSPSWRFCRVQVLGLSLCRLCSSAFVGANNQAVEPVPAERLSWATVGGLCSFTVTVVPDVNLIPVSDTKTAEFEQQWSSHGRLPRCHTPRGTLDHRRVFRGAFRNQQIECSHIERLSDSESRGKGSGF